MEEKRKYPRFDVVAKIRFKKAQDATNLKPAFVKDISAEGFCFCSKEQLQPGEILEIEIIEKSFKEAPIYIKGQVAWSNRDSGSKKGRNKGLFLTGVKVLGVRKADEARFIMLYCERMLAELKSFLRM